MVEALEIGSGILGTGGGGNPYIGKLRVRQALREGHVMEIIPLESVPDEARIVAMGGIGAPLVSHERIKEGREGLRCVRALEERLGIKVDAIACEEIGGQNSMEPLIAAAMAGLPVVDCDGMGRAFPELQMVTPTIWGIGATPMAIADDKGNSAVLNTISNHWTETFARSLTVDMGASALIALFPMTGKQVKEATIPGTLSLIQRIGSAIRESHEAHTDPVEAVCEATGGFAIWEGKVGDVARRTVGGFARGTASIQGVGDYEGRTLEIDFQNEFLIARDGDDVLVSTPDLITVLDAETGEPITTESLRYGFRVAVLGIPSDHRWRSEKGLELVGPEYFGYDFAFSPVESRMG